MSMKTKVKGPFTIVDNDSCDPYIIPVDKLDHWYNEWMFSEAYDNGEIPGYAVYCGSNRVTFKRYELK
jgi:hypothetical protein